MGNIGKWNTPASIATILSTDLNSLSNGSLSTPTEGGATYDNSANLDLYGMFELVLASLTPTGSPSCSLYFLPTLDGTNYSDRVTAGPPLIVFPLDTATGAKRVIPPQVVLLPYSKGKFCLLNSSGVPLGSVSNTVKIIVDNLNLNG